jgi:hypothetical protein
VPVVTLFREHVVVMYKLVPALLHESFLSNGKIIFIFTRYYDLNRRKEEKQRQYKFGNI